MGCWKPPNKFEFLTVKTGSKNHQTACRGERKHVHATPRAGISMVVWPV